MQKICLWTFVALVSNRFELSHVHQFFRISIDQKSTYKFLTCFSLQCLVNANFSLQSWPRHGDFMRSALDFSSQKSPGSDQNRETWHHTAFYRSRWLQNVISGSHVRGKLIGTLPAVAWMEPEQGRPWFHISPKKKPGQSKYQRCYPTLMLSALSES